MARKSRAQRRSGRKPIPAAEVRRTLLWLEEEILGHVVLYGDEGVQVNAIVSIVCDPVHPHCGWTRFSYERRRLMVWASIERLCETGRIQRFFSHNLQFGERRLRLREMPVLDRIVHALGTR